MIKLEDFIKAINYKVTGGSEYLWDCFGPNARYLDSDDSDDNTSRYHIGAIFDSKDQTVYSIEVWDYVNDREYRWINPMFISAHLDSCVQYDVDMKESMDGRKYIDLDVAEDILEKANALANGLEYDSRVKVPVDFSDEDLLKYMKLAHEMDITFNELVERAIKEAIKDYNSDPEGYKKKAERFIDENYTSIGSPS